MTTLDLSQETTEAAPARKLTGTHVGIEIDGNVIRVVTVAKGQVKEASEFTSAEEFAKWAKKARIRSEVLVVFSGARTMTKVTDKFPATEEALYRSVLESLAEDAGGGIACARLGPPSTEASRFAVVSFVPESDADYAWRVASLRRPVVVASSLLGLEDGLNLAVRNSGVELSTVSRGVPQQVRVLNVGGLDQLQLRFQGIAGDSGEGHLADIFAGRPVRPEVADIVSRYVNELCQEVGQTVAYWKRTGAPFGAQLIVHGPGFLLPDLQEQLLGAAVEPKLPGLPFGLTAPYVKPEDLTINHTALCAALADAPQYISFINRVVEEKRKKGRTLSRRATYVVGGVVAIVAVGGATWYPIWSGGSDLSHARTAMQSAEANAARAEPILNIGQYNIKGTETWRRYAQTEPDWAKVDAFIMGSAPAKVQLTDIQIVDNGQVISVTLDALGSPKAYLNVEEWLFNLQGNPIVTNLFSTTDQTNLDATGQPVSTKFDVQFDLSRSAFQDPRPLPAPGAQLLPASTTASKTPATKTRSGQVPTTVAPSPTTTVARHVVKASDKTASGTYYKAGDSCPSYDLAQTITDPYGTMTCKVPSGSHQPIWVKA